MLRICFGVNTVHEVMPWMKNAWTFHITALTGFIINQSALYEYQGLSVLNYTSLLIEKINPDQNTFKSSTGLEAFYCSKQVRPMII